MNKKERKRKVKRNNNIVLNNGHSSDSQNLKDFIQLENAASTSNSNSNDSRDLMNYFSDSKMAGFIKKSINKGTYFMISPRYHSEIILVVIILKYYSENLVMYHNVLICTDFLFIRFIINLLFKSGMHLLLHKMLFFYSHLLCEYNKY
jgi:hypothetical protein